MSDTIDDYKAQAEFRKQERAERRAAAEARLVGLNYSVHNDGAHIVIWEGGAIFDYWPGTDRWRMRNFKGQFGFGKLLAAIRQRKIVALDLSKVEERVMAHYAGERRTMKGGAAALHNIPRGMEAYRTVGALCKPYGATTGRIVVDTPPWQELPSSPDEDKAYVDKMEKAYPHLKGEDE